jgi:cysteine desulfurase / selenocysteine lyase
LSDAPDFEAVRRAEFGALGSGVYFNAASYAPLPARATRAVEAARHARAAGELGPADFVDSCNDARAVAAQLINAAPADITLTPNTTVGLNLAAAVLIARRRRGDRRRRIVVSHGEFPANVYPWMALAHHGYEVTLVDVRCDGSVNEGALLEAATAADTAALALSSVQFATGFRADLAAFGAACRARDVLFIVDAIQQLGALPLDVEAAAVDVLATGSQKWLCSPFGTGFAWVRPEVASGVEPLVPGWLAFEASSDFDRLVDYRYDLLSDGRRFEAGTLPFHDLVGFVASCRLILELGVDRIAAHNARVQAPLRAWAAAHGVAIPGGDTPSSQSGIVALPLPAGSAAATFERLSAQGVQCVIREGALRFSPHFYNTVREAERVVSILDESRRA